MRVFFRKIILGSICLLLGSLAGQAQIIEVDEGGEIEERSGSSILDDTTKQVYGPTTTRFTYEANIKYNNPHYWSIDTSIIDLHKYQFISREEYLYNNLGNIGTPANSIFPLQPEVIGQSAGFTIFDLYWLGPDKIKYYDTKSPHSSFNIIWGGDGRAITDVNYARNIDERSGFGFDYRGLFIDKQIQRSGRGDRNVRGTYYTLYGHYGTRDGKYKVLGNFIRNNHLVDEYGGILTNPGDPIAVYFDENRQLSLTQAENNELRTNFHLYHQYKLNNQIQLYHQFDRYKQQNDFNHNLEENPDYFDFVEVDSAEVRDRSKITYRQHELGLKGDIGKTFYNFYYKYRDIDYRYKYLNPDTIPGVDSDVGESYGGVNLRFGNDSTSYIEAFGEYLQGGNFKIGGSIQNSWFHARAITSQFEPAYIYKAYRGSHDVWVNDFDPSLFTKVEVGLNVDLGILTLKPSVSNTLLGSYLYFREQEPSGEVQQTVLPSQASSDINILSPSLGLELDISKKLKLKSTVIATNVSGGSADAVNIPDIYARGQIAFNDISFDGNLEWRLGFDAYWRSTYFANGYDPAIMQFYVHDFEVKAFPIIDFFADAKVNRARIFLKLNNVYEIFSPTGYFATPEYPGQTTIFDFGLEWAFYD
nr:putative porin [Fulvivirga aurantia]